MAKLSVVMEEWDPIHLCHLPPPQGGEQEPYDTQGSPRLAGAGEAPVPPLVAGVIQGKIPRLCQGPFRARKRGNPKTAQRTALGAISRRTSCAPNRGPNDDSPRHPLPGGAHRWGQAAREFSAIALRFCRYGQSRQPWRRWLTGVRDTSVGGTLLRARPPSRHGVLCQAQ